MGSGRRRRVQNGEIFLESVCYRLDRLEVMLMDLHWATVGQWRQPVWEESLSEQTGFVNTFEALTAADLTFLFWRLNDQYCTRTCRSDENCEKDHPKSPIIVKYLAEGHECRGRDSNPHSETPEL